MVHNNWFLHVQPGPDTGPCNIFYCLFWLDQAVGILHWYCTVPGWHFSGSIFKFLVRRYHISCLNLICSIRHILILSFTLIMPLWCFLKNTLSYVYLLLFRHGIYFMTLPCVSCDINNPYLMLWSYDNIILFCKIW